MQGGLPKNGGLDRVDKKEGVVLLRGRVVVDIPMHTMLPTLDPENFPIMLL